jgi:hypothetical protein
MLSLAETKDDQLNALQPYGFSPPLPPPISSRAGAIRLDENALDADAMLEVERRMVVFLGIAK